MYADTITDSLKRAIDETARRRKIQSEYNDAHGIVPTTIVKEVREVIESTKAEGKSDSVSGRKGTRKTGHALSSVIGEAGHEGKGYAAPELTLSVLYEKAKRFVPTLDESVEPQIASDLLRSAMIGFSAEMEFEKAAAARDLMREFEKYVD
jgi:excinuclease UvrABC helicase subunit UvrB